MLDWEFDDPFIEGLTLLTQTFEACKRSVVTELSRHDLTLAQFTILTTLNFSKNALTPGQLSCYVFRERHTISALLSRMEKAGYLKKARNKDDERVVEVRMTAKGRAVIREAITSISACSHELVESCFTPEEIGQWNESLRRLRDHALSNLGESVQTPPECLRRQELTSTLA